MRGRALLSAQKPLLSFPFHPFAFPSGVGSVSHPTLVPPPSTVLFSLQHPGDPTSSSIQHRAFSTHQRGPSPGPGPGPGPHDSRPNVREGQTALRGGVAWSSCRVVLHPIHAKLCLPCNKVFAAVVRLRLAPRTAKRVGCGCAAGPTIRCLDADTSRTMSNRTLRTGKHAAHMIETCTETTERYLITRRPPSPLIRPCMQ
jgi:hypothetical protein